MAKKTSFKKIAELSSEGRDKVKTFFTQLFGSAYAEAMVKDYTPEGETIEVKAKSKKKIK